MISENQYDEYLDRLYTYDSDDPDDDQGITMASQVARAGTYILAAYHDDAETIWEGGCQPFADWLYQYVDGAKAIIDEMNENADKYIDEAIASMEKWNDDYDNYGYDTARNTDYTTEYDTLLCKLFDTITDRGLLRELNIKPAVGKIWDCQGPVLEAMQNL